MWLRPIGGYALAVLSGASASTSQTGHTAEPVATPTTADEAAPPRPTIRWIAPIGCPDETEVRTRVESLIGRRLREPGESAAIEAEVLPAAPPQLRIVVHGEGGMHERLVTAADCTELAEMAAVIIAVTIDPSASLRVPEVLPAEPPRQTPPPKTEHTPAPTPKCEPVKTPAPPMGMIRVGGGIGLGPLPGPSGALDAEAGARWRHARIAVGFEHQFAGTGSLASGVGVRVSITTARVVGCYVGTLARRLEFPLCAGINAGVMTGRGVGVPRTARKRLPWVGGVLEGGATLVANRWLAFGLVGRVGVPFVRPGFSLDDFGVVHRAPPAAFSGLGTIELRFLNGEPRR